MRPFQRFQARIKCELHFQCHCSVWLEREFVLLFVHYLPFTVFKCTCIIFLQDFQLFFFVFFSHSQLTTFTNVHGIWAPFDSFSTSFTALSQQASRFFHSQEWQKTLYIRRKTIFVPRISYTLLFCATHSMEQQAVSSEQCAPRSTWNYQRVFQR